jgi:hypothetical protein
MRKEGEPLAIQALESGSSCAVSMAPPGDDEYLEAWMALYLPLARKFDSA